MPREFSWAQDGLEEIRIEPREGGFAYERGPHGFTIHWGRVMACEAPRRLVFTWQIAPDRSPQPDPGQAGEVEVRFTGSPDGGTEVALEHRGGSATANARRSTATASSQRAPGRGRWSVSRQPPSRADKPNVTVESAWS